MPMPLSKTPPLTSSDSAPAPVSEQVSAAAPAVPALRADALRLSQGSPDLSGSEDLSSGEPEPEGLLSRLRAAVFPTKKKTDDSLRDVLEDYIETLEDKPDIPVTGQEKSILANVFGLRDLRVSDVMVPRADIAAMDLNTPIADVLSFIVQHPFSRYPVFRNTLDDLVGTIHIKDILGKMANAEPVSLTTLVREAPIVSPALPVIDLLLLMRESRKHMVFVVDEYGGIDGLVTIGDITESIIGDIDDELDPRGGLTLVLKPDGSLTVDARVDINTFEAQTGPILTDEERENVDTVGGLVSAMAGHVPSRGEVLAHSSGAVFEVLDADPRRVKRLRVRNLPKQAAPEG